MPYGLDKSLMGAFVGMVFRAVSMVLKAIGLTMVHPCVFTKECVFNKDAFNKGVLWCVRVC